jgi:hypothetical protein
MGQKQESSWAAGMYILRQWAIIRSLCLCSLCLCLQYNGRYPHGGSDRTGRVQKLVYMQKPLFMGNTRHFVFLCLLQVLPCVHSHTYTHTYTHTRVSVLWHTHLHTHTRMLALTYIHKHVRTCKVICIHASRHTHMHAQVSILMRTQFKGTKADSELANGLKWMHTTPLPFPHCQI